MLTQPSITDQQIIACLHDAYNLAIHTISFLPIGADFNTAVYRVTTLDNKDYFLKLRRTEFLKASVLVPKYLSDLGITQIIPPLKTNTSKLWSHIDAYTAIVYPYIHATNSVDRPLSDQQWIDFGTVIKRLHSTAISSLITADIPTEQFPCVSHDVVKEFLTYAKTTSYTDLIMLQTAQFLNEHAQKILAIIQHTQDLLDIIKTENHSYVICHADLHGWNIIKDDNESFYIIDWDTITYAPKERDLMFINAGISKSSLTPLHEEELFYTGYGPTDINYHLISYYRFNRIIQDIAEYCQYIFLSNNTTQDKMLALFHLQSNFLADRTIDKAYQSYAKISSTK